MIISKYYLKFYFLFFFSIIVPVRKPYVLGLHFFTPAHIMKLVEIVICENTSVQTARAAMTVTKKIRKTGVLVSTCCDSMIRTKHEFVIITALIVVLIETMIIVIYIR